MPHLALPRPLPEEFKTHCTGGGQVWCTVLVEPWCDHGSCQQFPFLAPPRRGTVVALILVCNFMWQAQEDLSLPTTSAFTSHMGRCKAAANSWEEPGETDRALAWGLIPSDLCKAFQKNFIISNYVEKKYAKRSPAAQCSGLPEAIRDKDIFSLLQAYAENVDLSEPLLAPLQQPGETILHLAVLLSDQTSLHIVDFLVQNSWSLAKWLAEGNTPLYCCCHNKPESVKLLLKAKANIAITNEVGETALDLARRMRHPLCEELLLQAQSNQFNRHVHVEYEWWLGQDDMYESDEDLDEKLGPMKTGCAHSQRCYHPPATAPRPEAAGPVPCGGWTDTCPPPTALLHSLDVPPAPFYKPPFPPQQAKTAPWGAYPPFLTSSSIFAEDTRSRSPPLPLSIKHKDTSSEPAPWVTLSPEQPSPTSLASDAVKATVSLFTPGPSKVGQPGPYRSLQEPNPCSGHAWDVSSPLPWGSSLNRLLLHMLLSMTVIIWEMSSSGNDELTFHTDEIIVVSEKEDSNWKGWIEGQPHRKGVFLPAFIHMLNK
ncbi:LOW QUALITY PROTEIN: arf-GAP with SH3 domain, ANK repeat and PH domain-containing protein 2-like [Alca torda]